MSYSPKKITWARLPETVEDHRERIVALEEAPAPVGGGNEKVKVTLTSAQIQALDSTPVELIPAQGAGTLILIHELVFRLRYNSAAYNATEFYVRSVGAAGQFINSETFLDSTSDVVANNEIFAGTNVVAENAAVEIYTPVATGAGDSEVDVYITYEVLTL